MFIRDLQNCEEIIILFLTYIVIVFFFFAQFSRPLINGIVPAIAFVLSTMKEV